MQIPKNVTVMIDAGAIIKLRGANIDVGSLAQGINRSGGALQVLGTPATNSTGNIGTVNFTSYYNNSRGHGPGDGQGCEGRAATGADIVFHDDADHEGQRASSSITSTMPPSATAAAR